MGKFNTGNSAAKGHGRPAGSGFSTQLREVVGKEQFKVLVQSLVDQALAGVARIREVDEFERQLTALEDGR